MLVLAGGGSTRMGTNKALVAIDGEPMLARVVRATEHLGPVLVIGGEPSLLDHVFDPRSAPPTHRISHIRDEQPGAGPFAALVAALRHVGTREALVVSCDLAYPNPAHIDLLVSSRRSGDADIALPLVKSERQWHAVAMSTRVIPMLLQKHQSGVRSMRRGFNGCSEILVCSSSNEFFRDVDTPSELDDARALIGRSNDLR